jgi:hypothetical protein
MCNQPKNNYCINGGEEEAHPELVELEVDVVGTNNQEEIDPRITVLHKENVRVSMNGGIYIFRIRVLESLVDAGTKVINTIVYFRYGNSNEERVSFPWHDVPDGYLVGFILPRHDSFGSRRSKEIQEYLRYLFDNCSEVESRFRMGLSDDGPHSEIFYIDYVEVRNGHQGTYLGLRIVHDTMVLLCDRWNITAMVPRLMSANQLKWPEENHRFDVHPLEEQRTEE